MLIILNNCTEFLSPEDSFSINATFLQSIQADMSSYTARIFPKLFPVVDFKSILATGAAIATADKTTISNHRMYFCCPSRAHHISLDRQ